MPKKVVRIKTKISVNTILKIDNLTKKFGHVTALKDLSFTIEKGNVYGILGPNGSGKSTTLGIVLNVVNKTSGQFTWFNGETPHSALKRVGAIIERPNFYPYMSAEQNLKLVCKIKGAPESRIAEKLAIVGLLERRADKFKTYSLGMKQRLAIASALLNNPEVLILDEPTNGLDPQGIHQIREIIKTIAKDGTTILLASHLLDEVEKVCSHVLIIRKGQKIYSGPVEAMSSNLGYFELAATDNNILKLCLEQMPYFNSIKIKDGIVYAYLKESISAEKLNETLFNKGVILNHLNMKVESLEDKFLNLTNNVTKRQ